VAANVVAAGIFWTSRAGAACRTARASLLVTVLACRYQLFAFLLVGLAGFAGSIHALGYLYFGESPAWPRVMMLAGAVCFFGALLFELRRTRGNTIDDVVNEKRL